ncbi:hypothetical protein BASA81_018249 [Batrachochytrium salamandrivorans]|nr:hypothetical protein BASA81_018249 [Batrachochytrium salamandrivorans]
MESLSLLAKSPKGFPITVRTKPSVVYNDASAIYGASYSFEIPLGNGQLKQQYLKITANESSDRNGWDFLKTVKLVSERGTLQTMDFITAIARFGLINQTPTFHRMVDGFRGRNTPDDDRIMYVPLFWFFSDMPEDYLQSRGRLWVEVVNRDALGPGGEPVEKCEVELISYFRQLHSSVPSSVSSPIRSRGREGLAPSYDSFMEKTVLVPAGSKTARVDLTCPNEVFHIHFVGKVKGSNHYGSRFHPLPIRVGA